MLHISLAREQDSCHPMEVDPAHALPEAAGCARCYTGSAGVAGLASLASLASHRRRPAHGPWLAQAAARRCGAARPGGSATVGWPAGAVAGVAGGGSGKRRRAGLRWPGDSKLEQVSILLQPRKPLKPRPK